jgi:hypothetical protein
MGRYQRPAHSRHTVLRADAAARLLEKLERLVVLVELGRLEQTPDSASSREVVAIIFDLDELSGLFVVASGRSQ